MGEQSKERKSPLRIEDEDELLKAFREQLLLERELERAKIDLRTIVFKSPQPLSAVAISMEYSPLTL